MEDLCAAWPGVHARIADAPRVLLACDYDGTLTPIVSQPALAYLPQDTRLLLEQVVNLPGYTVAILSGRALHDLRARVGLERIIYGGNHGLEIIGRGLAFTEPISQELRPLMAVLSSVLRQRLAEAPGVLVEDKGLTLSVHYRNVEPERVPELLDLCEASLAPIRERGHIAIQRGKEVWEVRPAVRWGKGEALTFIRDRAPGRRGGPLPLVIYVGDDETDDEAFDAAKAQGGISVFVGDPREVSRADYFVRGLEDVRRMLQLLGRNRREPSTW